MLHTGTADPGHGASDTQSQHRLQRTCEVLVGDGVVTAGAHGRQVERLGRAGSWCQRELALRRNARRVRHGHNHGGNSKEGNGTSHDACTKGKQWTEGSHSAVLVVGNECGTRDWHGSGKWPRRFSSDHHVLPPCPRNLRSLGIVSTFAASTSSNCFATCSTWALGTAATCAPGHKNMKRGCIGRPAIASEVARACREYVTPICCWRWRWCWCCIR